MTKTYTRKAVGNLFSQLEEIEGDTIYLNGWLDSTFHKELFEAVNFAFFDKELTKNGDLISRKRAVEYLDFIDKLPPEIFLQLSRSNNHEIASFLIS